MKDEKVFNLLFNNYRNMNNNSTYSMRFNFECIISSRHKMNYKYEGSRNVILKCG